MDYWQKQTDKPLFPDLIWSQPQHKRGAGKLLIIGGQAQEFSHVAAAYAAAEKSGAGTVRAILPNSTKPYLDTISVKGQSFHIEYAQSNGSGSFGKAALSEFFAASDWADGVLLAGDFGRNSETTTVLDGYLLRCVAPTTIADNAFQSIALPAEQLLRRPTTLILGPRRLQKLGIELELTTPVTSTMSISNLAEILHKITKDQKGSILAEHSGHLWVSSAGKVSSTVIEKSIDQASLTATAAVWIMQNPTRTFEALTTAIFVRHDT
jgi:hypothetical protein